MSEYNENVNEISDESLNEIVGGKKQPVGPGTDIQWDDPRCLHAVSWCCSFRINFKGCTLFSTSDREKIFSYCDEFCRNMSEQYFNLGLAVNTFLKMSAIITVNTMTPAARGSWTAFAQVFNSIFV